MIEILFFTIIGIAIQYKFNILELFLSLKIKPKNSMASNIFKINDVPYEGKQLVLIDSNFYVDGIKQDTTHELNKTYDIKIEGKETSFYCLGNLTSLSDINVSLLYCNNISCVNINGDVSAAETINCQKIDGDVTSGGYIKVEGDINGDISCSRNLSCNDVSGDIACNGDLNIHDIKGDVNCDGNIQANFINGSVTTENLEINKN